MYQEIPQQGRATTALDCIDGVNRFLVPGFNHAHDPGNYELNYESLFQRILHVML